MSPSPELESGQSDMLNSAGILGTIITSKMLSDYENIPVIDSIATTPTVDRVSPPPSYVASTNTQHTNDKPTPALKPKSSPPQLIPDLPIATEKALKTFEVITANHYQYGTLGRSQEELESMTCDCSWTGGPRPPTESETCGPNSDCINRLTQVECLPDDCRCRGYCQNQRFQKRHYANIEVVQTEKKGFGIRAGENITKDAFVYEYVGDVVSQPSFAKRMRNYAEEGIKHFYFMMLQKEEFLDATKRGGIGRFLNHSCAPNCYVAKWTVGTHVRMGIFASRNILKDEEMTFNYNVDRYGHEAQPCYCGEPNCIGFIGGKTQTDIGAMDDLYLDALGITDEVNQMSLKGTKKKKGRKLDEDYIPILKPMVEKEVPKLLQALRQVTSRKIILKLLTRIQITDNEDCLRQLMRLRGFSMMSTIMRAHSRDFDMMNIALESMFKWPLLHRNKVEDSRIEDPVRILADCEHPSTKDLATKLLSHWDTLETRARIPKRLPTDLAIEAEQDLAVEAPKDNSTHRAKRPRYEEADVDTFKNVATVVVDPRKALREKKEREEKERRAADAAAAAVLASRPSQKDIAATIAAASVAARIAAEEASKLAEEAQRKQERKERRPQTKEEREKNKEKRLMKLVGGVIVKTMSKYAKQMSSEVFKKHAKELTKLIADKEKKGTSYKENKLDSLSDEKVAKIKKFTKEYIAKVLKKLAKMEHTKDRRSSTSALQLPLDIDPDADDDGDDNDNAEMAMTVEEAMDMAADDVSDEEDTKMGDGDDRGSPTCRSGSMGDALASLPPETPLMSESWISPSLSDVTITQDPRPTVVEKEENWGQKPLTHVIL